VRSNAPHFVDEVVRELRRRYGRPTPFGKSRLYQFGNTLSCSINYSKRLRGEKYFFGLAQEVVDPHCNYPETRLGAFVVLLCGGADKVLMLPRSLMLEALRNVSTRKLDVFTEGETYVLQTTGHPKINVTEFLNAFPAAKPAGESLDELDAASSPDRAHVKIQSGLIRFRPR
jgi:hypothetical protein